MARRVLGGAISALTISAFIGFGGTANAAIAKDKLQVLSDFTQASSSSQRAWDSARRNQGDWAQYKLDWSTDLCSASPDQPLGFDFRMSCHRHDFGYRNYKKVGSFPANKSRLDNTFYFDMKQVCSRYSSVPRGTCNGLAWTYYQAVRQFGRVLVSDSQVKRVARTSR